MACMALLPELATLPVLDIMICLHTGVSEAIKSWGGGKWGG